MWGAEMRGEAAVVFRYVDAAGRVLYEKLRSLSRKRFWRRPAGQPSVLHGLDQPANASTVIVTEGELDAHALRAVGFGPVVSVPDGTGSGMSADLLAPLGGYRRVLIATDADEPGHGLAKRLAAALGPARCHRVLFREGEQSHKDACAALKAGWTRAQFEGAFESAAAIEAGDEEDKVADDPTAVTMIRPSTYRAIDGGFCEIRVDRRTGQRTAYPISNSRRRSRRRSSLTTGTFRRCPSGLLAGMLMAPRCRV